MNLETLIGHVRRDLDDTAQPPLYTDEEITAWLNQAVLEAAIRARLIKDDAISNPTLCVVAVTAGDPVVTLPPEVFVVRQAALVGAARALWRVTAKTLDRLERGWSQRDLQAPPQYLVMDLAQGEARLWPTPDADGELHLRVWRKPLEEEQMEQPSDEPAVRITDPLALKDWALRCAYLVKDSELYDPARAQEHEGIFEARFGPRPTEHAMQRWLDSPPTAPRGHFF